MFMADPNPDIENHNESTSPGAEKSVIFFAKFGLLSY